MRTKVASVLLHHFLDLDALGHVVCPLLARLGGDEFACVVPFDPRSPDRIDQFANLLIERVSRPVDHDGVTVEVTVSVGIAADLEPDRGSAAAVDACW